MKKRKKTIGIYVMITLMLVAGIPIIVMLTSSYLTTKNLLIERNDLNKESAVNLILAEEKSLRRSTESKLKSMAELPAMKTEFSMGRIRSDLSLAIAGSNSFLAVTFGTEDDEYVTFNPLPDDYKPTIRPWYKGAVKAEGEVYWTAPYLDTVSNQFVTSASIRVKNSHNQVGVLSVDVSYESIQNILSSFTVGRTGNVTLVSESGVIVTSKNTKQIGKNIKEEEVFQKIKEAKNPTGMVGLGDSNKVNDVLYDKSADSNVWAYSEVKASDLDKELGALVRTTIIVTILMLLFVGLVSYAAIKVVAAIIDCFNRYFRKVGEGKLEKMSKTKRAKGEKWTWDQLARRVVYPDKAGNEIQQMADNYNVMIEGTGALIQKVQKESNSVAGMSDSLLELSKQTNIATEEVSQTITGIAEVTGAQAQETEYSVSQMQNLSQVVKELRENVGGMSSKSQESTKINQENLTIMDQVDDSWRQELAQMERLMSNMTGMNDSIQNINSIIGVINDISYQTNLLGRMRDLAVQSSNGTLSNDDRDAIKKEYTALSDEIDRISNTTEFNTKSLLTGEGDDAKSFTFQIGANANQTMSVSINNMSSSALKVKVLDLTQAFDTSDAKAVAAAKDKAVATAFEADTTTKYAADGTVDAAAGKTVVELKTAIESETDDTEKAKAQKTYDDALAKFTASDEGKAAAATVSVENNPITKIDEAIKAVSAQRADLGAAQNRLEHTINNLGTTQENLSEANSRIRDVDMAQEMMSFTKSNILSQAATSMLAQANSMPNSVLSLLQG